MAKSKVIRITPNILKCAAVLRQAMETMPAGETRERAAIALGYLDRAFSGKPQTNKGGSCPVDKAIIAL